MSDIYGSEGELVLGDNFDRILRYVSIMPLSRESAAIFLRLRYYVFGSGLKVEDILLLGQL